MSSQRPALNLDFVRPPSLAWTPEARTASVEAMVAYVSEVAEQSIAWYLRRKKEKQTGALILRLTAILATSLAGLIPILAQISSTDGRPAIQPGWASVALLIAAASVVLDRFYGFSSAWMRFTGTELKVRSALHDLHLDWQSRLAASGGSLRDEDVGPALAMCRAFVANIDGLVQDETAIWIAEFSNVVKEVDESARSHAETRRIKDANGDQS